MCEVCQCCGGTILPGDKVVKVQYGELGTTRVKGHNIDYFHEACEVGIRSCKHE